MHRKVATELLKLAKTIMAEDDPIANEKLSKLFLQFHKWATKKVTYLPATAPVAVQILKGMDNVKKKLRGKTNLTGRAAVEAIVNALADDFTTDAPPIKRLYKDYHKIVPEIFKKISAW